ncbi:hypothetical protein [Alkalibaculum bacchi]|uniref:hypothetical protein n=1 Tax=Alkalibaculum bacchi TaxID=645887 RepID=UPI0026EF9CCA|nr:hypothetical protein [Alkalibaculum bacchi]
MDKVICILFVVIYLVCIYRLNCYEKFQKNTIDLKSIGDKGVYFNNRTILLLEYIDFSDNIELYMDIFNQISKCKTKVYIILCDNESLYKEIELIEMYRVRSIPSVIESYEDIKSYKMEDYLNR